MFSRTIQYGRNFVEMHKFGETQSEKQMIDIAHPFTACLQLVGFDVLSSTHSDTSLVQKHDGCWWFGQPGRCGSWKFLISTFIQRQ